MVAHILAHGEGVAESARATRFRCLMGSRGTRVTHLFNYRRNHHSGKFSTAQPPMVLAECVQWATSLLLVDACSPFP